MSLKELLSSVDSREDLFDICRANEIPNYSNKNRASLEEWIFQSMNSKQFIKDLLNKLSDSAIILLSLLMEDNTVEAAKTGFLAAYSLHTFFLNLKKLTSAGIIFISDEDDVDVVSIPKEFRPWIKEYLKEIGISIENAPKDEEESSETGAYKDFDALVWSAMIPIDNLRNFLEDHGLQTDGTKMALIHRIFYENQISREEFLSTFGKEDLRILAEMLELTKGGNKQELVDRIVEKLPLRHLVEEYAQVGESESEDEEVVIETPTTLLKLFTSDAIPAKKIKATLDANGFDTTGTRSQIVRRLLEDSQISINDIFDQMFNLDELKEICMRYGLKKGGKKQEVIATILDNFSVKNLAITYSTPTPAKAGKGAASYSTDSAPVAKKRPAKEIEKARPSKPAANKTAPSKPKTTPSPKPKKEEVPSKSKGQIIFELLKEELNDKDYWTPKSFISAKVFNESIRRSVLKLKKDGKLDINVEPQKDIQEVIAINGKEVLIFCAVVTTTAAEKKESVQSVLHTFNTVRRGFNEVIALIWDPEERILNADERNIQGLKDDTKGLCLIKKNKDYKSVKGSDDKKKTVKGSDEDG